FQAGDFAGPAFAAGFGDAGLEIVADLQQPGFLAGVRPQLRAPDTAVLMSARGSEVPGTDPERDLAELEMMQELVPLFGCEVAVFFSGSLSAAAGDEGPVVGYDVLGVYRGVAHGRAEIGMSEDFRGDVRRQPSAQGVSGEEPAEVV